MAKRMTIEDLGKSLAKQFGQIYQRFDETDEKFESKLSAEIGSVRNEIRSEIGSVRSDIHKLVEKTDRVERKVDQINKRTFEDDGAFTKDIIKLQDKDKYLERVISKLKIAKA